MELVEQGLWDDLLSEVNRQLEAKSIIMTERRINIIDATSIEAVQSGPGNGADGTPKHDLEAGWHVKNDIVEPNVPKKLYKVSKTGKNDILAPIRVKNHLIGNMNQKHSVVLRSHITKFCYRVRLG